MKTEPRSCFFGILLAVGSMVAFQGRGSAAGNGRPLLLAHFMPWFQAPPLNATWGYHWTMNFFNPEREDADGRREIASFDYPLTGPYDSRDEDVLEYQVLLMKITGIDGVIVDWYGPEDFWDYAVLNEATHSVFDAVSGAGLRFALCYEDQTIKHMVNNGHIRQDEAVAYGREALRYAKEHWFETDAHARIDGRPLLLNFGPQFFKTSAEWETLFEGLPVRPLFFTLDNRLSPAASGAFPWPPMWKTDAAGVLTWEALDEYLTQFYTKTAGWKYRVAGAFPGFRDIYKEAGVDPASRFLDHRNGETFRSILDHALEGGPDVVQLVTWNDYGEGTSIEPTREFGNRYLEIVQDARKTRFDSTFAFRTVDLAVPFRVYTLRKEHAGEPRVGSVLDRVHGFLVADQPVQATALLDSLEGINGIRPDRPGLPRGIRLEQNFPNPFNPNTLVRYSLDAAAVVTIAVFDARGRRIGLLAEGMRAAGDHETVWNAGGVASGVYVLRLFAGGETESCKCVKLE